FVLNRSALFGNSKSAISRSEYPLFAHNGLRSLIAVSVTLCLMPALKWFTEFGHLNRGDMLTSEQHRCHNEKKKFQRRV
ncbi:hypothetical protein ACTZT6_26220, partial [Klebsiella pneumoniae]